MTISTGSVTFRWYMGAAHSNFVSGTSYTGTLSKTSGDWPSANAALDCYPVVTNISYYISGNHKSTAPHGFILRLWRSGYSDGYFQTYDITDSRTTKKAYTTVGDAMCSTGFLHSVINSSTTTQSGISCLFKAIKTTDTTTKFFDFNRISIYITMEYEVVTAWDSTTDKLTCTESTLYVDRPITLSMRAGTENYPLGAVAQLRATYSTSVPIREEGFAFSDGPVVGDVTLNLTVPRIWATYMGGATTFTNRVRLRGRLWSPRSIWWQRRNANINDHGFDFINDLSVRYYMASYAQTSKGMTQWESFSLWEDPYTVIASSSEHTTTPTQLALLGGYDIAKRTELTFVFGYTNSSKYLRPRKYFFELYRATGSGTSLSDIVSKVASRNNGNTVDFTGYELMENSSFVYGQFTDSSSHSVPSGATTLDALFKYSGLYFSGTYYCIFYGVEEYGMYSAPVGIERTCYDYHPPGVGVKPTRVAYDATQQQYIPNSSGSSFSMMASTANLSEAQTQLSLSNYTPSVRYKLVHGGSTTYGTASSIWGQNLRLTSLPDKTASSRLSLPSNASAGETSVMVDTVELYNGQMISTTRKTVTLPQHVLHFPNGGLGVGVGYMCTVPEDNNSTGIQITPAWDVMYGNTNLIQYSKTAPANYTQGSIWLKPVD